MERRQVIEELAAALGQVGAGAAGDACWPAGVLEVVMLAGFYLTVSYLVAAMQLPAEPFAARFPAQP